MDDVEGADGDGECVSMIPSQPNTLTAMDGQPTSALPADNLSVVPAQWDEDPTAQLRALRNEVFEQRKFPRDDSPAFMAAAWDAVERLPSDFQPPERTETLLCIGRFYYFHDMAQPMIDVVASAVRAAVLGGHRFFEMQARAGYGGVLREAQDFVGCMRELGRALDITREMGSALEEAKILNSLANTYSDAGLQREALLIFERAAACFEANNDHLSAWMTLDNASLAALRLGDIQRGIAFSQKARLAWDGEPKTPDEQLWVVQGAPTNCEFLIHTDRTAEAVELAQAAKAVAAASGLPQAE